MLGIRFPQLPGKGRGAETFNLGAFRDESPRISLLTSLYGIGHLVKQHERPNKLQFAVIPGIFPFFTSSLLHRAAGTGECVGVPQKHPGWCHSPSVPGLYRPRGSDVRFTRQTRCSDICLPGAPGTELCLHRGYSLSALIFPKASLSFYFQEKSGPKLVIFDSALKLMPPLGVVFKASPNHCK